MAQVQEDTQSIVQIQRDVQRDVQQLKDSSDRRAEDLIMRDEFDRRMDAMVIQIKENDALVWRLFIICIAFFFDTPLFGIGDYVTILIS